MSKQDGYASRTAADLERKYNFGKTFADVYGLVADAQRAAEEAKSAYDGLDQEQIFNLLTNFGEDEGIYRENGTVYINASYIKGGKIVAGQVEVEAAAITGKLTLDNMASISFEDLSDADTIRKELGGGLTADQTKTLITDTLIASPIIAGGKFADITQNVWGTMDVLKAGYGGFTVYNKGKEIFYVMGDYDDFYGNISLAGTLFIEVNDGVIFPRGAWDFSNASVTGL